MLKICCLFQTHTLYNRLSISLFLSHAITLDGSDGFFSNNKFSLHWICISVLYFQIYMAFHQHFGSDITSCVLCVQLIALVWSHTNACTVHISCGTNAKQVLILCDVTTKVLVKCRTGAISEKLSYLVKGPGNAFISLYSSLCSNID